MKEKSGGGGGWCTFHPKVVVVGVCHLCLRAKLHHLLASSPTQTQTQTHNYSHTKSIINIFAFPFLLNFLHFFHHSNSNLHRHLDLDASTTHDDSFMSMKIEGNGAGSWEDKNMNVPKKVKEEESTKKSVVGHVQGNKSLLRWRKRIGQAFQVMRWKRSNKANAWHVGTKVEGVKVMRKHNQCWIATLTNKITK